MTNTGSKCVFRTNWEAPNYQLVEIDLSKPGRADWRTLVPGHKLHVLNWASCVNSKLVLCYMQDVKTALHVHDLASGERTYTFPLDIGDVVSGVEGFL